jgi:hypothetical protein
MSESEGTMTRHDFDRLVIETGTSTARSSRPTMPTQVPH